VPAKHPVHAYRQAIATAADGAGLVAQGEPISVVIDAVFARPKSHMRKAGVKPDAPKLPRPDVDNIGKAVLDALQDVIGDDTCVARLVVEKSYGPEGRTTVRVS
jgi:Holliday junction resolvase RusA-like endonuclease